MAASRRAEISSDENASPQSENSRKSSHSEIILVAFIIHNFEWVNKSAGKARAPRDSYSICAKLSAIGEKPRGIFRFLRFYTPFIFVRCLTEFTEYLRTTPSLTARTAFLRRRRSRGIGSSYSSCGRREQIEQLFQAHAVDGRTSAGISPLLRRGIFAPSFRLPALRDLLRLFLDLLSLLHPLLGLASVEMRRQTVCRELPVPGANR